MSDYELTGDDALFDLSKALKAFDTELRKEFNREIRSVAKPMLPIVREALRATYPKRGGLNERMARSRVRVSLLTGRDPGLKLIIPGVQVKLGEQYGVIRHPVYARADQTRRQWTWVSQDVEVGAVNTAVRDNVQVILPGIALVVEQTATRVLAEFARRGR